MGRTRGSSPTLYKYFRARSLLHITQSLHHCITAQRHNGIQCIPVRSSHTTTWQRCQCVPLRGSVCHSVGDCLVPRSCQPHATTVQRQSHNSLNTVQGASMGVQGCPAIPEVSYPVWYTLFAPSGHTTPQGRGLAPGELDPLDHLDPPRSLRAAQPIGAVPVDWREVQCGESTHSPTQCGIRAIGGPHIHSRLTWGSPQTHLRTTRSRL